MHIGGRSGSRSAPTGAVKPALHKVRAHAAEILGATLLAPVLLVAATGSTGPQAPASAAVDADVTALAAVLSPPPNTTAGPAVVAVARTPEKFRFATSAVSAPPPATVVTAIGSLRIPAMALAAYAFHAHNVWLLFCVLFLMGLLRLGMQPGHLWSAEGATVMAVDVIALCTEGIPRRVGAPARRPLF